MQPCVKNKKTPNLRSTGLLWPPKNTKFSIIIFHLESVVAQNKHRFSKEQPILAIGCGYCYSKPPKSWFLWIVPNMSHFKNVKFTIPGVTLAVTTLSLYSPKLFSFENIENRGK